MARGAGRGNVVVDNLNTGEAIKVYISGTTLYVCKALVGTTLSEEKWQISKIVTSETSVAITWANGNEYYDNAATDLSAVSGYSYS
jgi:hypothetical protein